MQTEDARLNFIGVQTDNTQPPKAETRSLGTHTLITVDAGEELLNSRFKKPIKKAVSIGTTQEYGMMDRAFIDLDEVRRQQREEVIQTIKQEEILEKQRILLLKDTSRRKEDLEKLREQFTLERRDAQIRI